MMKAHKCIIFAPNIRSGGGLVLLKSLLAAATEISDVRAFLDVRSAQLLPQLGKINVSWVKPGLIGRIRAELALSRSADDESTTLCFSGVPPLLRPKGRVIVYSQNALTVSKYPLRSFALKTATRLLLERGLHRFFASNVDEYIVQTPSMCRFVARKLPNVVVRVVPFLGASEVPQNALITKDDKISSFLYPAHDDPHKNHENLLEAWSILAAEGIHPILLLTLKNGEGRLAQRIAKCRTEGGQIRCVGVVEHAELKALLRSVTAVVYPSFIESFGLPLLEARQADRPIVASELDYVRDVCDPIETFDPYSAQSIARAIKRVLNERQLIREPYSPADAWDEIMLRKKT